MSRFLCKYVLAPKETTTTFIAYLAGGAGVDFLIDHFFTYTPKPECTLTCNIDGNNGDLCNTGVSGYATFKANSI